ncbi:MAG: serine/threonine transporter SstT [Treponema sp.]|nr:serine/threonine transporter SstT [Treponema sp.]
MTFISKLVSSYNKSNLILRIAIGLLIGALLGLLNLEILSPISFLGELFVGSLKAIAPILVFLLVISSLAKGKSKFDKRFSLLIFLYVFSTLLASFVSVIASNIFPQTLIFSEVADVTSAPSGISEVLKNLLVNCVTNPVLSLTQANYIGILVWAILIGLALKKVAAESFANAFKTLSDAISLCVRWIINLAPIGLCGLMYKTISTNGLAALKNYGSLVLLLVGTMLFAALVVNPILVAITLKQNPYPLVFRCLRQSGITAFFTRSSAANIPVNMELCEDLGLDKDMYSVAIPLGATINMDGAAVTIAILTLAATHTLGISVDFPTALLLCIVSTLGACGASGVAGGSLLLIPMACSMFGIPNDISMQVVGVGFIIGVIQDSLETALNSSGDVIFAATAEYHQWKKEGREIPKKF